MSEQLSGPQLFARYVVPCAESRGLSQEEIERLMRIAKCEEDPDVIFLERCFPKPVGEMREFWLSSGFVCLLWDKHMVQMFWWQHKGQGGDCAVKIATACFAVGRGVRVISGSDTFVALDALNLCPQLGDNVRIHLRT